MGNGNIPSAGLGAFIELAKKFFEKTHGYVVQGIIPVNMRPNGAFPFRTGISATRIAVANVVEQ